MLGENGSRQVSLILQGLKSSSGTIPVPDLVDKLGKLQELVYTAGEYVHNEPYKEAGRRPARIVDKCTLIFKDIKSGSTELETEIQDCQGTLTESGLPFGIQSVELVGKLIDVVEQNENPFEATEAIIKDPSYRNKMALQLQSLIPRDENAARIFLDIGDGRRRALPYTYRPRVERLILGHEIGQETIVQGAITRLKFTGDRSIELWTTSKKSFKCSFEPEMMEQIAKLAGSMAFVEVRGLADLSPSGETIGIKNVSSIIEASETNLDRIEWQDQEHTLVKPVKIDIEVDLKEELWTIENEELEIMVVGRDFEDAMNAFQETFAFLVDEYVLAPDESLTLDAQELKQKIMKYLGG